MKKIFKYVEPIWCGNDGKISLRSIGAIALIVDFIVKSHDCITEAGLICALLAIKAFQSGMFDKSIPKSPTQTTPPAPVQNNEQQEGA